MLNPRLPLWIALTTTALLVAAAGHAAARPLDNAYGAHAGAYVHLYIALGVSGPVDAYVEVDETLGADADVRAPAAPQLPDTRIPDHEVPSHETPAIGLPTIETPALPTLPQPPAGHGNGSHEAPGLPAMPEVPEMPQPVEVDPHQLLREFCERHGGCRYEPLPCRDAARHVWWHPCERPTPRPGQPTQPDDGDGGVAVFVEAEADAGPDGASASASAQVRAGETSAGAEVHAGTTL